MARKSFGCSFHTVAEMLNFYWSTFQPDSGDFCKLVHILKLEINIHQVFGYYFSQCFFLQHCFQRSKRHLPPVSRLRKKTASNRLWLESLNISDCITGGMRLYSSHVCLMPAVWLTAKRQFFFYHPCPHSFLSAFSLTWHLNRPVCDVQPRIHHVGTSQGNSG